MRILILGACGFVGRNCVNYFLELCHEIHAVYHERPLYLIENVKWHHADLRNPDDVSALFAGDKYDVVIQAAAATTGCKDTLESPSLHTCNNAVMNSYIFKYAVEFKVGHLIFPSCSVMYPSKLMLTEDDFDWKVNPAYTGFAWTKIYCEKMCEFYASISDTKFTCMRNSNFYGPYDKFDLKKSHVFGATITKVMQATDKVVVWGTGDEARDFVYINDYCEFVRLAIENQTTKFELFNCGSGQAVKIKDLVKNIIEISGKNLEIEYDLSAPSIPTSLCLDYTKAKEKLGWEPKINLEEGISKTIGWWNENCAGL